MNTKFWHVYLDGSFVGKFCYQYELKEADVRKRLVKYELLPSRITLEEVE